ncbi:Transposon Tf2-9 polyprotein [Labeo rohita]|uniref:Gypsy retrotransposon integrase-like protein 1 n=1 Tax=Labeo rohita TaxID=84645 RepID=A0ABQ8MXN0_LABRO|nr:Transposon Tf2-9 polyprotein [Labeo rohita]
MDEDWALDYGIPLRVLDYPPTTYSRATVLVAFLLAVNYIFYPLPNTLEKYLADSLVGDYHGLNEITVKNRYPLTLMSSAFEVLQGTQIFTKLNIRNAYHLVRIKEGDEWKMAFNTPLGHFEYWVLPFWLVNTPAVFQAEHIQHVRCVLQRLLENQLFVKAEKCIFHASSVIFLGSVVSTDGISMDPAKVCAVLIVPSLILAQLSKGSWETAHEAFDCLKKLFTSAPILITPNPSRQFIVEVDTSNVGVGAVLSQRSHQDDRVPPCTFFSHRLSPAERNYDVGSHKLLTIRLALAKRLNAKQARWALFFGRFNFTIGNCLSLSLYVLLFSAGVTPPDSLRTLVRGTLASVYQWFWWPALVRDVHHFVASCPVCNGPPAGQLRPLPIPSYLVHGRISLWVSLWDYLPRQSPTEDLSFELCQRIGATASLSSGFHPQTNGQAERVNQILRCLLHSCSQSLFLVTSLPYSPPKSQKLPSPLSKPLLNAANVPGRWCTLHCVRQENAPVEPLIMAALRPLITFVARECGYLLVIYPFNPSLENYHSFYSVCTRVSCVSNPLSAHPPVLRHPTPVLVKGSPVFRVKKLLAVHPRGRGFQYLVDWEGYGSEPRTFWTTRSSRTSFALTSPLLWVCQGAFLGGGPPSYLSLDVLSPPDTALQTRLYRLGWHPSPCCPGLLSLQVYSYVPVFS